MRGSNFNTVTLMYLYSIFRENAFLEKMPLVIERHEAVSTPTSTFTLLINN